MPVTVHLAHGASGSAASMQPWVDALATRGVEAATVQLPRGRAEAAVRRYRDAAPPAADSVIGGHSFGGRVASLLAAEERYAGLVLLSYPLHPPGSTERWRERSEHFTRIACPVLVLSGDRDPFARIELLQQAVEGLPEGHLVVYPTQRHGLRPVLAPAADEIQRFVASITPAGRTPA